MAMKIDQAECTSCAACEPVCPTKSIAEKKGMYKINAATCTECQDVDGGPKCVDACPAGDSCIIKV
jgi:ferredoxin